MTAAELGRPGAQRLVSIGAAPGVERLVPALLEALGPAYRLDSFATSDIVLVPASSAVTPDGVAAISALRRSRPALGIVAVTTGPPVASLDAVAALDAGADAVVRVETPRELAAHVHSVARRVTGARASGPPRPPAGRSPAAGGPGVTASKHRRRAGHRTRVAAAIVSGGTALGLAGVMAAHAGAANSATPTRTATDDRGAGGDAADGVQPQAPAGDSGSGFTSSQPPADAGGTGSDPSSQIGGVSGSTGRFGGVTGRVPSRPNTRTRGS